MIATVLAYGFMTGWMPFANWSDNYLSVFSSLLIFVELSFVQAIRAGMVEENNWNKSWIGIALFGLNVVWMVVLMGSMVWNAFEETWKRCLGWTGGGADGAGDEEQGVATLEEARGVIAVRDATNAQLRETIAQCQDKIAEQDCRERTRVVPRTVTPTPQQSCVSRTDPNRPRRSRVSELPRTRTSRSLAPGRQARRAVVNERGAASQERGSGGDCDAIAVSRSSRGNRDVSTDFRGNQKKQKKAASYREGAQ